MKKYFFVIFLLLTGYALNAQPSASSDALLKLNLTSAIDIFSFPSVQFSMEKSISAYYSISIEAGLQVYNPLSRSDNKTITPGGFRSGLELRRYLMRLTEWGEGRESLTGLYVGANIFFRRYKYNDQSDYANEEDRYDGYTDHYWVRRRFNGINGLIGYQGRFKKGKIFYDAYGGIGGGIFSLKEFEKDAVIRPGYKEVRPSDASFDDLAGKYATDGKGAPNLTLGLRIGIKL